ncbi:hypothetical protein FOCC_FOCC013518 [Frankliniella occidentalis]|nr:hypothetical protein FOCC_FOCC013518 [Frankliniella occidentalis]
MGPITEATIDDLPLMIKSNDRQVSLSQVDLTSSGRYRCEVSAEGPAFQTVSDHGNMQVSCWERDEQAIEVVLAELTCSQTEFPEKTWRAGVCVSTAHGIRCDKSTHQCASVTPSTRFRGNLPENEPSTLLPKDGPHITGGKPKYRVDEDVDVLCSVNRSKPAASLLWFINGEVADDKLLRGPYKSVSAPDGLENAILGLHFKGRKKALVSLFHQKNEGGLPIFSKQPALMPHDQH